MKALLQTKRMSAILCLCIIVTSLLNTIKIEAAENYNIVIPLQYESVDSFINGYAFVYKNGEIAYIDKTGKEVSINDSQWGFSEGLVSVEDPKTVNEPNYNKKFGFKDKNGTLVIPYQFSNAAKFSEGLAQVEKAYKVVGSEGETTKITGFIDTKGNTVIPFEFNKINGAESYFSGGLASVEKNGKYGFIDKTGKFIIPNKFTYARPFSEGLALVQTEGQPGLLEPGKQGFIDKTGKLVIPCEFDATYDDKSILDFYFSDGLCPVRKDGKYGYIDKTGKLVIPYQFEYASLFKDGVASIHKEPDIDRNYSALIDKNGDIIIPYGVFDTIIIPQDNFYYTYDSISSKTGGLIAVEKDGKWGFISLNLDSNLNNKPSSWAEPIINEAISLNLVPQSLQGNYTSSITRAEFCALAVQFYEKTTGRTIATRTKFNDTTDENVEKIASQGIVTGTGNNSFSPNQSLTREQAAVILARLSEAIGKPLNSSQVNFSDKEQISSWALEAVGKVKGSGIMNGTGTNMFSPKSVYSVEQSIVTIMNLKKN